MGMYNLTRQDAADELGISIRSIDRYIKAGKLRSKKKGKLVYIHDDDISNIGGSPSQPIIIQSSDTTESKMKYNNEDHSSQKIVTNNDADKMRKTFEKVYTDLRNQIEKKDEIIQTLSIQIGQTQEQVKQSISVSEHNRSQMLLEESKGHITKQMDTLSDEKKKLEETVKNTQFDKKVLMVAVFVLLAIAAYYWFKSVG